VEARLLGAGNVFGEREGRERSQEKDEALGPYPAEDGRGGELRAEGVTNQMQPRRSRSHLGERRSQQLAAESLAYQTRAPLHQPEAQSFEWRPTGTRLTGERVELKVLLGPERHFHLAEQRHEIRECAWLQSGEVAKAPEREK